MIGDSAYFEAAVLSCLDLPALSTGSPVIFVLPLEGTDGFVRDTAARILSHEEHLRLGRFAFARDALQHAVARILVRIVLGRYLGCTPEKVPLAIGSNGKPRVDVPCGLDFSISHCEGWVAVAVARDATVGIDIETVCGSKVVDYEEIAQRYYSACEYKLIKRTESTRQPLCFIELWTLKEAYLKAIGRGLSKPLHECRFWFEGRDHLSFRDIAPTEHVEDWHFELYGIDEAIRLAFATNWPQVASNACTHIVELSLAPTHRHVGRLRSGRTATAFEGAAC